MGFNLRLSPGLKGTLAVLALVYGLAAGDRSPAGWAQAAAYVVLLQGSVAVHELGHVLAAGRLGLTVHGVTLTIFGGYTRYEGVMPSRFSPALIAFAGPLASGLLAAAFLGARVVVGGNEADTSAAAFTGVGVGLNVLIAAFNLLPLPTLDGGQIVAALWRSLVPRADTPYNRTVR